MDGWGSDIPPTLQQLCVETILNDLESIADLTADSLLQLKHGLELSLPICKKLVQGLHEMIMLSDCTLMLFRDSTRTRLEDLNLRDVCMSRDVTDDVMQDLLKHKPREINISGFPFITATETIDALNDNSDNLTRLYVDNHIFSNLNFRRSTDVGQHISNESNSKQKSMECIFKCPKLRNLGLQWIRNNTNEAAEENVVTANYLIPNVLSHNKQLVCLDLSFCDVNFAVCGSALGKLENLRSLVLHSVFLDKYSLSDAIKIISKLRKLRYLDLSIGIQDVPYLYDDPETNLWNLVSSLPHLTHLDLSGTNWPGLNSEDNDAHSQQSGYRKNNSVCSIPALEGRHLEFLGLMECQGDACERINLPADMVTGNFKEKQILLSVHMYMERENMFNKALYNLFLLLRDGDCDDQQRALDVTLTGMYRHPMNSDIQISGSACLFHIVKANQFHIKNTELKRRIVRLLVTAMEIHRKDQKMLRNGSLTLQYFGIPKDVFFLLKRLVKVLLATIDMEVGVATRRASIDILDSIMCCVDDRTGRLFGDLGIVKVIMKLIETMLSDGVCNDVMEMAWRVIWQTTDENALTSQRFVDSGGLEIFYQCFNIFPGKNELLRCMAGVLNNVAEVPTLRPKLMMTNYMTAFTQMLDIFDGSMEIPYLTCGALSHVISDGQSGWTIDIPKRENVMQAMMYAIKKWHMETKGRFNYRSLEPLLRLLKPESDLGSHYFAVWAICNLTKTIRDKYCPMVEREGGLDLLKQVSRNANQCDVVRQLANQIIDRCARYKADPACLTDDEETTQ